LFSEKLPIKMFAGELVKQRKWKSPAAHRWHRRGWRLLFCDGCVTRGSVCLWV